MIARALEEVGKEIEAVIVNLADMDIEIVMVIVVMVIMVTVIMVMVIMAMDITDMDVVVVAMDVAGVEEEQAAMTAGNPQCGQKTLVPSL